MTAMYLRTVENLTGFRHFACTKLGADNRFYDVVVVKADFHLRTGALKLIDESAEVILADQYSNPTAPELGFVERAGDVVVFKPATDVLLTGTAVTELQQPQPGWYCELGIYGRNRTYVKRVLLTGRRYWQWSSMRSWHLSEPECVAAVPLTYGLAYGGRDTQSSGAFKANPAGIGWYLNTQLKRSERYLAPQIQYFEQPAASIDKPISVAGFGPIARWWTSRYQYAGTYDAKWRAAFDASPHSIYPADFNSMFFQSAHPDWIIAPYLLGDEQFWLWGVHQSGKVHGRLPAVGIQGGCVTKTGKLLLASLALDTVHFDLDRSVVSLVWRASLPQSLGVSTLALRALPLRDLLVFQPAISLRVG